MYAAFLFSLCCSGRLNYSGVNQYVYKYIQQDSLKTNSFGLSLKTSDFRISAVHFSSVLLKKQKQNIIIWFVFKHNFTDVKHLTKKKIEFIKFYFATIHSGQGSQS